MKKKVLVTGCTGFIGNHVVKRLLQEQCEVVATSAHEAK
ncbi:MAG TPA: NAD-dependent epimerase/dehydratase family protein, partial [Chitinophaga sp.]